MDEQAESAVAREASPGRTPPTMLRRAEHRSAATVVWMAKRIGFLLVVVLTGWAVFELLIVPIIDDRDPILAFLALWVVMAYVLLPRLQRILTRIYVPDYFVGRARTGEGLLGDPINLAVIGTGQALLQTMQDAGWTRADDLTLRSGLRLVRCTLLQRRYPAAPVSPLFMFTHRQDLAFEQEIPGKPSRRHHVRFWKCPEGWYMPGGLRADWVGAGTYDRSVGFSMFTLQITHKIGEDTDLERDHVLHTMEGAGGVTGVRWVQDYFSGYHARTGGGDAISTDGNLPIVRLAERREPSRR